MKNKTLRNDLIVIVILFLIIEGLFFFKSRKQGQLIEITKDNQIYGYYSLNEDQIIKIDQENTIQIKNQKVKRKRGSTRWKSLLENYAIFLCFVQLQLF